jgi:hypothetical protein
MEDKVIGLERMQAKRFEPDVRHVPNNVPVVHGPVVYPVGPDFDIRYAEIVAIRLARAAALLARRGVPGNG